MPDHGWSSLDLSTNPLKELAHEFAESCDAHIRRHQICLTFSGSTATDKWRHSPRRNSAKSGRHREAQVQKANPAAAMSTRAPNVKVGKRSRLAAERFRAPEETCRSISFLGMHSLGSILAPKLPTDFRNSPLGSSQGLTTQTDLTHQGDVGATQNQHALLSLAPFRGVDSMQHRAMAPTAMPLARHKIWQHSIEKEERMPGVNEWQSRRLQPIKN